MIKSLLLVSIISINLFAQDFYNIYKPLIHPVMIDSKEKREQVSTNLNVFAELNPSLIYYYVEYLRHVSVDTKDARDAMMYLNLKKNEFFRDMGPWISNEFDIVFSNTKTFPQFTRLWVVLYGLKRSPSDLPAIQSDSKYKMDFNYQNYITYLYFLGQYTEYNPDLNYQELINKNIEPLMSALTDAYLNTGNYSADDLENFYKLGLKNWFFFKGSVVNFIKTPLPFYLTDFLIKVTSPGYVQKSRFFAGIQRDNYNEVSEKSFNYYDDRFSLRTGLTNIDVNDFFFSAGVNIKLREYKSYFSSINLTFYYSQSKVDLDNADYNFLSRPYYIIYSNNNGTRVDPKFKVSPSNLESNSFLLKALTPLVYIYSSLSIEAGVYLKYLIYNYNIVFVREDKFYTNQNSLSTDILIKYQNSVKYTSNIFKLNPLVAINYYPFDFINFRISAFDDLKFPQAEIFLNFNF
jgi:hypothetical protein